MSKRIIDLSRPILDEKYVKPDQTAERPGTDWRYHGYICIQHRLDCPVKVGTHFEIASHCVPDPNGPSLERFKTDDIYALDIPVDKLYEIPTTFLRLDRNGLGAAIAVEELENALNAANVPINPDDALLVQAQKKASCCEEYMYFSKPAVDWIISKKLRLLGSDSWENHDTKIEKEPRSVKLFYELFKASVWCLINLNNMDKIRKNRLKLTVLPLPTKTTVTTCRAVAVEED